MFDVGFSELVVIGLVALVVIGPERLPRVARTLGHLVGRLQRYVADVKADINREIELDELRKMRDQMQKAASDIDSSVSAEVAATQAELDRAGEDINKSLEAAAEESKPAEAAPAEAAPAEAKPAENKPA